MSPNDNVLEDKFIADGEKLINIIKNDLKVVPPETFCKGHTSLAGLILWKSEYDLEVMKRERNAKQSAMEEDTEISVFGKKVFEGKGISGWQAVAVLMILLAVATMWWSGNKAIKLEKLVTGIEKVAITKQ